MTALAPAAARTSIPSRNGKKASEATTEPARSRPAPSRLAYGNSGRVDAAHLAGANAQGHAVATEDDGVGLDELGDAIGKKQVFNLRLARRQSADHPEVRGLDVELGRASVPAGRRRCASSRSRGRPWPAAAPGRAGSASRTAVPRAAAVNAGASRTSTKCLREFMARTTSVSTVPLKAMMPPKADVESV
jgi:hypothetical protein